MREESVERLVPMRGLLLCLLATALHADWKVSIDKKPSPITGKRNAHAHVQARRSGAIVLIGCHDAKPILRIAEDFRLKNKINDALTKSQLERAIDKSEEYGFAFSVKDNQYFGRIKIRLAAASEYMEAEVPAGYNNGTYFLVLDDRLGELMPRMTSDTILYAQLPYKQGDKIVEFKIDGLEAALGKLSEAQCTLR